MQYIYPMRLGPLSDHCEECGGETLETPKMGPLNRYLVVTLDRDGYVENYATKDVCQGCSEGIHFANTPFSTKNKLGVERSVKRIDADEVPEIWGLPSNDWPFTLDIDGERVSRNMSIMSWTRDPDSEPGYVYDNENVVYFIFEETN